MTDSKEPLRISTSDLAAPEVEEYVETQQWLQRDVEEVGEQPWLIRVIYANWFYLAICSAIGGLVAWAILEPYISDDPLVEDNQVANILIFPMVAGFVGLFLGAAEGIMCRNMSRAAISGSIGLATGFLGGLLALIPTSIAFGIMANLALNLTDGIDENGMPNGMGLLVLIMGRGVAWALAAIPAGLGQGFALREKKVILNGGVGAVLGGLIGGILFDPISLILTTPDGEAAYSRAVGFAVIGLGVGLFVGLVESWTKTAWLIMQKGPLAGKQFVMFKDATILGSSPKAQIYLFKDDAIEPTHAIIYNRGGRFEIEDQNTPDGTYINGIPIKSHMLQAGDQIVMGKTVLEFSIREAT